MLKLIRTFMFLFYRCVSLIIPLTKKYIIYLRCVTFKMHIAKYVSSCGVFFPRKE